MLTDCEIKNLPFKARGLEKMTGYIGDLQSIISAFSHRPVKILEIGFGFGQVMAELFSLYRGEVELYGINSIEDPINTDKVIEIAMHQGRLPNDIIFHKDFLHITYGDAGAQLPYPNAFFDLIISQVCIPYVSDKLHLISEVCRVLKPEGKAKLHVGFEHSRLCDGSVGKWITLSVNRYEREIDLETFFNSYPKFLYYKRTSGSVLEIDGGSTVNFDFSLSRVVNKGEMDKGTYGICSVYN